MRSGVPPLPGVAAALTRRRRYTGHEYDSEFIAVLRQECHKYIKREKRATLGAARAGGAPWRRRRR